MVATVPRGGWYGGRSQEGGPEGFTPSGPPLTLLLHLNESLQKARTWGTDVMNHNHVRESAKKRRCPSCGSENVQIVGTAHGIGVGDDHDELPEARHWQHRCEDCGKVFWVTM